MKKRSGIEAAVFAVTLTSLADGSLPFYLGSTLRGAFGWAFKKVACALRRETCLSCMLKEKCVYSYVFETPREAVQAGDTWWRRYPQVPHPFIIEPPQRTGIEVAKGEPLEFRLILVGRAMDYLPYFVCAFQMMAAQGLGAQRLKFELEQVTALAGRRKKAVFRKDAQRLAAEYPRLTAGQIVGPAKAPTAITVNFLTPTLIKDNDRLSLQPPFKLLVRNLLRRISALERFHCGNEPTWDYQVLLKKAEEVETSGSDLGWKDWVRYSTRIKDKMEIRGIIGRICYRGDLGPFWSLLRLGELLHVGKWTSFGLGKYGIE